jgi:hypothetical protein
VRIATRGWVRLTLDGPEVGTRERAAWNGVSADAPVLIDGDTRVRAAVGVFQLNQEDVAKDRALEEQRRAGLAIAHPVKIEETFRLLVWLSHVDLELVLREDVELRPAKQGASPAKGWDAGIFLKAGTEFFLGEQEGWERAIEVMVAGQRLSGWVDRDAIYRIIDHRGDVKLQPAIFFKSPILKGPLFSHPRGKKLLSLDGARVGLLDSEGPWSRVRFESFDVTVVGWARTRDLSDPSDHYLGGLSTRGSSGGDFAEAFDERATLPRQLVPKGTLLRDPTSAAVVGVARMDAQLARDAEGRLWAPSPWGPIEVAVYAKDSLSLEPVR